ncbi:TorF family putative porin [Pseudomonas sp. GD03860]|uniref:TorF family putative porin n=1 Tax=Pseudomonas TaxID=286 RepID=UPI0023634EBA|nr:MULTISPECIES: TorF family putative porin [Pseudomonas]MDD2058788.1 TorF family putative porin [Pseudomonas putida]MDH0637021.1 TorF family putative porin [Pseudomonas sp. GD03860]
MNARTIFTVAGLLLAPLTSQALTLSDDFSLELTLDAVSDYRSRGVSQTLGDPALQAGATLIHGSGLYLGAWTSNVDYGFDYKTRQEVDYYAGWYWQATDAISLDLGYLKYSYPKEGQFNMSEVYAILDLYGVKLGANYSSDTPNAFGEDQDTLYSYLGYSFTLPADVGVELRVGYNDVKDPAFWATNGDNRDAYYEWEVKLTRAFFGVTWGLSYIDTDLKKSECMSWYGYDDLCSATLVASASKTF